MNLMEEDEEVRLEMEIWIPSASGSGSRLHTAWAYWGEGVQRAEDSSSQREAPRSQRMNSHMGPTGKPGQWVLLQPRSKVSNNRR